MHALQEKLLSLADGKNLGAMTLREIGGFIGETSPQKIKHHLAQLEKRGLIRIDKKEGVIERTGKAGWVKGLLHDAKLLTIPIIGSANAGPAQIFANTNIEGYLRVSSNLLERPSARSSHRLFALKV